MGSPAGTLHMSFTDLPYICRLMECMQGENGPRRIREELLRTIAEPLGALGVQITDTRQLSQGRVVEDWFCHVKDLPGHMMRMGPEWFPKHPYFEHPHAFDPSPGALLPFGEVLGRQYYDTAFFEALHAQIGYRNSSGYGYLLPDGPTGPRWGLAVIHEGRRRTRSQMKEMRRITTLSPAMGRIFSSLCEWESVWSRLRSTEQLLQECNAEAVLVLRRGQVLAATGRARQLLNLDATSAVRQEILSDLQRRTTLALTVGGGSFEWRSPAGPSCRVHCMRNPLVPAETILRIGHSEPSGRLGLQDSAQAGSPKGLTEGELRVTTLVAQGLSNKEIAYRLELSYHTVRAHLRNVFRKLGVDSRAALILMLGKSRSI